MSTRTTNVAATPAQDVGAPDGTARLDVAVPGSTVLVVGRLDVHAAADVRVELARQVVLGSGELVLDLAGVTGVDATGLGLLVGAHRRAGRAGRVLVLQDVPAPVGRLLLLTRLDRVLVQRRTSQAA
jgi:anti-anti-sigma factor